MILTYYFTDYTLKSIAEKIGKPGTNISYIHVRTLKKRVSLRRLFFCKSIKKAKGQ